MDRKAFMQKLMKERRRIMREQAEELKPHYEGETSDTPTYDFDSLSQNQRRAVGMIAMGRDGGIHPRTLESLEKRGMIEGYGEEDNRGNINATIRRYRMPVRAHMAWCEWCAENA